MASCEAVLQLLVKVFDVGAAFSLALSVAYVVQSGSEASTHGANSAASRRGGFWGCVGDPRLDAVPVPFLHDGWRGDGFPRWRIQWRGGRFFGVLVMVTADTSERVVRMPRLRPGGGGHGRATPRMNRFRAQACLVCK